MSKRLYPVWEPGKVGRAPPYYYAEDHSERI